MGRRRRDRRSVRARPRAAARLRARGHAADRAGRCVPNAVTALAFLAILGAGYALVEVAGLTLLQRHADDAVRARAFAVVESSYWLTTGAGAMLAPLVIAVAGPRGALAIVGAALPLLVLARMTRQGGELARPCPQQACEPYAWTAWPLSG